MRLVGKRPSKGGITRVTLLTPLPGYSLCDSGSHPILGVDLPSRRRNTLSVTSVLVYKE